ncbi:hypothetical protein [Paenibacillus sp. ALJ109b]|uniref:hypothetical protein n=1 Tax=Paenibacillus sp. ALJ109b TaxID=2709068 RepID=UPI001F073314|nr:hypothetical protein [Paenibacillus sp. ALJ109b]
MKEVIKNVLLGTVVFVVGFAIIFVLTSSDIEAELTYYAGIAYALLYLASVISVCTALLLKKMTHESAFNLEEAQNWLNRHLKRYEESRRCFHFRLNEYLSVVMSLL